MPVLRDQGLGRLKRPFDHAADADRLLAQPNAAAVDARDLQQVIDQVFELPELALDDAAPLQQQWIFVLVLAQQLHGVGQRGQRIP